MQKKKTTGGLLMTKDEMVLLKNSEAAKNTDVYGNLYAVLSEYGTFSRDQLKNNQLLDDKAKSVLLSNKQILLKDINDEWVGISVSDESDEEVHCQLCGRKNKYVYFIQNRKNEKELNVGSSCINKFPGIANVSTLKHNYKKSSEENKKNQRRIEFDGIDLKDIDFIKTIEEWYKSFPVLLPDTLDSQIRDLVYNLNFIRTSYVNSGGDIEEVRNKYFQFKKEILSLKESAIRFYNDNKNDILICEKDMVIWLKDRYPHIIEKIQMNGGMFAKDTLQYAHESRYVEKNLTYFRKHLVDKDIRIINVNGSYIRFVIQNQNYVYPMVFCMGCKDFMKNIGCHCLSEENYSFGRNDLTNLSIEYGRKNFEAMVNRLISPLNSIGLAIERSEITDDTYYVRLPQMRSVSKWSRKMEKGEIEYKKVQDKVIMERFSQHIFEEDREIAMFFEKIKKKMNNQTSWMSKQKKEEAERMSQALTMTNPREFI